jgi:hypothetical protein
MQAISGKRSKEVEAPKDSYCCFEKITLFDPFVT